MSSNNWFQSDHDTPAGRLRYKQRIKERKMEEEADNLLSCRCDLCKQYWQRHSIEPDKVVLGGPDSYGAKIIKERVKQDNRRQDALKRLSEPSGNGPQYTKDSLVTKQASRIDELISAHWAYQEKLLSAGQDKTQTFTWDQVMEMRKWDYCSSAKHFYGHGYEDAIKEQTTQPEKGIK